VISGKNTSSTQIDWWFHYFRSWRRCDAAAIYLCLRRVAGNRCHFLNLQTVLHENQTAFRSPF